MLSPDRVHDCPPLNRSPAVAGRALARSLASRVAVTMSRWAWAYAVWRERRRAVRELAAFDDRALTDLGIHRSEIERLVYGRDRKEVS
jgi:uncharacterized protein YjiS (DUF1127 family)